MVRSFPDGTIRSWTRTARALSPAEIDAAYRRSGVGIAFRGSPDYPSRFEHDIDAPAILFYQGDLRHLDRPTVAIVGTRHATGYGREVARRLGRRLAEEGVVVMSGLAVGIDLAAQRGSLRIGSTPVAGVAGTGLDVVYPVEGRDVWAALREGAGLLMTEAPLGAPPSSWRFRVRNRIMAGLADLVVVVESPLKGGSLLTVAEAQKRNVDVLAIPGPVTSAASAGCNRLISDGCGIACDADDVLVALGMCTPAGPVSEDEAPNPDDEVSASVLDAVDWTPTPLERILARLDRPALEIAPVLYRLEEDGWIRQWNGCWERCSLTAGST